MPNRRMKISPRGIQAEMQQISHTVKIELIRKFQRTEGNFDCCASAYTCVCKQLDCLWRNECLVMAQK